MESNCVFKLTSSNKFLRPARAQHYFRRFQRLTCDLGPDGCLNRNGTPDFLNFEATFFFIIIFSSAAVVDIDSTTSLYDGLLWFFFVHLKRAGHTYAVLIYYFVCTSFI
jgi:hypothetical protein